MQSPIVQAASRARAASRSVATLSTERKNALLLDLSARIERSRDAILAANARDLEAATASGLPTPKLARLRLTPDSITQLGASLRSVAALPDPVGQVTRELVVQSGMTVRRIRTPLGVVCMIYEARPGVTIDAFALCFKAGNACILKGGKEARASNEALASIARETLVAHAIDPAALTVISDITKPDLEELLQQDQFIDLVIPRGGVELIRYVARTSRIPTIQHYQGVNHAFVDASANPEMALKICVTGKTSAPATCNALECVLVHRDIAPTFVPALVKAYVDAGVEVRADAPAIAHCGPLARRVTTAQDGDFGHEFLDLIIALRVVDSMDAAISHIHEHGSNHTEAIITTDANNAASFTQRVQASCVLVNASTRMNDGFQLGLGAEIGISTSKIHAYGPMGLEELTTTRFVVQGDGQTR
jgi:glutamate-5-semialdehyde dehydrogenase